MRNRARGSKNRQLEHEKNGEVKEPQKIRNLNQALDKLRGEIDTITPHDCTSLNFEILEQIQIRKLLNNRSVIILDDTFKIDNTATPVIKRDGDLVISDIFSGCDMKHRLWTNYFIAFCKVFVVQSSFFAASACVPHFSQKYFAKDL